MKKNCLNINDSNKIGYYSLITSNKDSYKPQSNEPFSIG